MMSIRGFQCLKAAPVLVFCFFVSGWNPQDSAHEMESRASGAVNRKGVGVDTAFHYSAEWARRKPTSL